MPHAGPRPISSSGRQSMSTSSATTTGSDQPQPWPPRTVIRLDRRPGHARPPRTIWQRSRMSQILIGKHQATIYPEDNGYTGAISLGFDGRATASGSSARAGPRRSSRTSSSRPSRSRIRHRDQRQLHGHGSRHRLAHQRDQASRSAHRRRLPHPGRPAPDPADRRDQAQES